jgi:hypothetical protein
VQQVHQRKLRSIFHIGQFLTGLSIFEIRAAYWAVLSSRHPPVLNHELVPDIAFGHCHAALIFHKPQDCPAYFKGGV